MFSGLARLLALATASATAIALLPSLVVEAVTPTAVVVNQLHTNTAVGDLDTFVELRNVSAEAVDISGWRFEACNGSGITGARASILANTVLDPGEHYLLASEAYDLQPAPDQSFGAGLASSGGVRLLDDLGALVDSVGYQSPECAESTPAPRPADANDSVSRDNVGADTDANAADFTVGAPMPTASWGEVAVREGSPALEEVVEAESLLPAVAATAQLTTSGNCCDIVRYGDQALAFGGGQTGELGDSFRLAIEVPREGRYQIAGGYGLDPSFAEFQLAVDGQPLGEPVDLYNPGVSTDPRIVHGAVDLTAGRHQLTFTITGANPASTLNQGHRISVDLLRLRELPTDSRLTLTPEDGAVVHGRVPVYGWSTDSRDTLGVTIDGKTVNSRPALGDVATLVFEGQGMQGKSMGFANSLRVRGQRISLASDVGTPGGRFGTDWVDIPADLLAPGRTTVTIATGAVPDATDNKDDFSVRNVRLELADGTVLTPSQGSRSFAIGDGCCPDPTSTKPSEVGLSFDIPADSGNPGRGFVWDTTGLPNGEHSVSLTADGPQGRTEQTASILVDNQPPTFTSTAPASEELVKGEFVVDATVAEGTAGPIESLTATLDGEPVGAPSTHHTDDLTDGTHTVEFRATDPGNNVTIETVTFTSVAEEPDPAQAVAPGDGATGAGTSTELEVRATDPAGDPLEVTFLEATRSVPVAGEAFEGARATEPPAGLAGRTPLDDADTVAATSSDDIYAQTAPSERFPFQRYDLRVGRAGEANRVDVTWEGRVPPDREVTLWVFDMTARQWDEVATARGVAQEDITLVGGVDLTRALDGEVVHVLVQGSDPYAAIEGDEPDEQFENPADYDFSLAWLTDTQYLSEGAVEGRPGFGEAYTSITQWIADNSENRKIAYAAHTGDLINNWISGDNVSEAYLARARQEFAFASDAMKILEDAGVPYGVTPGNHDNKYGTSNDLYNEYFSPSRFAAASATADQPYYGGSWRAEDNHNHFDLFDAGGQRFVAVYLGFIAGQDEIDWASDVLKQHADRKAIFLTHEYLRPSLDSEGRGGAHSGAGRKMFEEIVLPNDNVFLTLSGHTHGVALNIKRDVGRQGRTVVEMLANYQFYKVGNEKRVGHFRLLQFDIDASEVSVNTYSPVLGDHNADDYDTSGDRDYLPSADEFRVPVDLASRTTSFGTDAVGLAIRTNQVIGVDDVASGELATATWPGLEPDSRYAWYARSADDFGGRSESAVFTFRTGAADVEAPQRPAFIAQPTDRTVRVGETATLAARVRGQDMAYQWQSRTASHSWRDMVGKVRPSLSVTPVDRSYSGTRYRLVASNVAGSATSDVAQLTVTKARSRTEATLNRARVGVGERARVRARVTAPGPQPAGQLRVLVNSRPVALRRLDDGRVSVRLPRLRRGEHRVRAIYLGSANTARSLSLPMTLRVKR